ncbi:MAG TPA: ribonuclease HIII [Nitrososphaeraceae archaeon]|nr:ribonuclease HIII [Nitrososphaeraceae archaeon]
MIISTHLGINELNKLKEIIITKKLKETNPTSDYELLRIRDDNINLICYKSGKIVYQNNPETMEIIRHILATDSGYDYELGSDEAGKGESFGPLVTVCVALKPEQITELRTIGVKDSKQLSPREIVRIAEEIKKRRIVYRKIILQPEVYNSKIKELKRENKNLNELLAWTHARVIQNTLDTLNYNSVKVVIDKFDVEKTCKRLSKLDKNKIKIIQKSRGESEIPVAVASILAKSFFEQEVTLMCTRYGINFRKINPVEIPKVIIDKVYKTHFKNISKLLEDK